MSTCVFLVGDVFEQLEKVDDNSVDLVFTSPPFIGLREYLPADHPLKHLEIGLEASPASFIDRMLELFAAIRPKLTADASIGVEFGDTYSESGGAGGDYYNAEGWRADQPKPRGSSRLAPKMREGEPRFDRPGSGQLRNAADVPTPMPVGNGGSGWPLGKSKALMPELFRVALAYGINPLTGRPSPAGLWRVRNVVTWVRSNPPVGALGDKFRTATSDIVFACTSEDRWWDEVSVRVPASPKTNPRTAKGVDVGEATGKTFDDRRGGGWATMQNVHGISATAPPLDWWNISAAGYQGAHFAVFPPELAVTPVQAMCPRQVCTSCGEPRRPIVEIRNAYGSATARRSWIVGAAQGSSNRDGTDRDFTDANLPDVPKASDKVNVGWTHCGCYTADGCRATVFEFHKEPVLDEETGEQLVSRSGNLKWRRVRTVVEPGHCNNPDLHHRNGMVLDPFGGSGTTGMVATGHGRDAILIDIDERNADLAEERIGPLFFQLGR